jgi:hypothetical protein
LPVGLFVGCAYSTGLLAHGSQKLRPNSERLRNAYIRQDAQMTSVQAQLAKLDRLIESKLG